MALIQNAKLSLRGWLMGVGILTVILPSYISETFAVLQTEYWHFILVIYSVAVLAGTRVVFKDYAFKVTFRACALGLAFVYGISLAYSNYSFSLFGWFLAALAFFHWSEYFVTAITNPQNLSLDSYMLNHSTAYHIALFASLVEFMIECYFLPAWKQPNLVSVLGLMLVCGGEMLRKLAMWTAGSNFNHYIRYYREDGHRLVTHGIFRIFRHPSYVGWFYWSVGTQLMLLNPLCFVAYVACSWMFFRDRVVEEEITLLNFFGEDYLGYQQRVPTGLPFITGYKYRA